VSGALIQLKKESQTNNSAQEPITVQEVKQILAQKEQSTLLRFSTAGSVDDGKSTLIGRLLHDSKNIYEDTLKSLKSTKAADNGAIDLAHLTDGLKSEREQGITIDVAYRYFSTPKRRFILADTPGHEQYTRNMATGSSTADLTIILIDARKGVITQTRRHAFIASLLGVPRLLVAVNKMDLMDYSDKVFETIKQDFIEFSRKLQIKELKFIPISALVGDNVVEPSQKMEWYTGETVMSYLENVYTDGDTNQIDFRFPVQYVIRPDQNYRGYAGQIRSGSLAVGEEIMVLPSRQRSSVKSIDQYSHDPANRSLGKAFAPMSVTVTLDDEIDISRGDMIVRVNNVPETTNNLDAMVIWMNEESMDPGLQYLLMHTSRETQCIIDNIYYKIDVNTLSRLSAGPLSLNEIGRISFTTKKPLFIDSYRVNRSTGNFILVHPESFLTVGAGVILDRKSDAGDSAQTQPKKHAPNLHRESGLVSRAERELRLGGYQAVTLWCTGLSGSGKSTIAKQLERDLFDQGRQVFCLDGDNIRHGINRGLGFSQEDRKENIRRVAEIAKLFNTAGITVICSLISPLREDRQLARQIIGEKSFLELYVNTPLEVCEARDPHQLYKKARAGEIQNFTGISAPYEAPEQADITLDTSRLSPQQCIEQISILLERRRQF